MTPQALTSQPQPEPRTRLEIKMQHDEYRRTWSKSRHIETEQDTGDLLAVAEDAPPLNDEQLSLIGDL